MLRANEISEGACYFNVMHRNWIALMLLQGSLEFLQYSTFVNRLDKIESAFRKWRFDDLDTVAKILQETREGGSILINDILLCTSLENFLKAKLLWNGFVIHWIYKKLNRRLANKQRTTPIRISDIKKLEGVFYKKRNDYSFKLLRSKTISLHTLINNAGYLNVLKIPQRILPFIKKLQSMRNTLHFSTSRGRATNIKVIDDYSFLVEYLKGNATKKHNHLIDKLGFNPNWKV
jgi:hypothetical protein